MTIQFRKDLNRLLTEFNLPKVVAEIGVAEGLFSRDMLTLWNLHKLYCVDNWGHIRFVEGDGNFPQSWHNENYRNAQKLLAPFDKAGKVVWLKGLSSIVVDQVPDDSLGLVYLDGDHSYKGVNGDLHRWIHKVVDGGIVAGHDYMNPAYGVQQAVSNFCRNKFPVHIIPEYKEEDAGFWFQKSHNKL